MNNLNNIQPTEKGLETVKRTAILADFRNRLELRSLKFFRIPYDMLNHETIVELSMYHMLGIIEKFTTDDIKFNLTLDEELNIVLKISINGKEKEAVLNQKLKLNNTSKFVKIIEASGWNMVLTLFAAMKLPFPGFDPKVYRTVKLETNYVWIKYLKITRQVFRETCTTTDGEDEIIDLDLL